jgi:RiboL-PSP-HEPN
MNETVEENFRHIRNLAKNIENLLGGESTVEQQLGNEFAGMFAVTIAATYEGIVKETLIAYAATFHKKYKDHMEKDLDRLNAKISIDDLRAYSRRFGLAEWTGHGINKNSTTFHKILKEKQLRVERKFRTDLIKSYENIFTWRNAYAHERSTLATFKDVYQAHRVAQYVIRSFVKAFELG